MTLSQSLHVRIAPTALVVAGLAAADWYLRPERAGFWIVGIATMAGVWLAAALLERAKLPSAQTESERGFVVMTAVTAGRLLAIALGVKLVDAVGLGGTLLERAQGVAIGLVLMVIGNMVPKIIGPLAAGRCSPAQLQSDQRFAGWAFTVAGLAYAVVWMFAPLAPAQTASTLFCAAAVVLVAGRLAWRFLRA
jgi:hypothetical protein